jgi:hypothetical protein
MGGSISVESELEKGTAFIVKIPLAEEKSILEAKPDKTTAVLTFQLRSGVG